MISVAHVDTITFPLQRLWPLFCLQSRYQTAKLSLQERSARVQGVVESLERDMELLCLTGVEDRLQDGVRPTLETLRNAGIKVRRNLTGRLHSYFLGICISVS